LGIEYLGVVLMKNIKRFIFLLLISTFISFSCNSVEPPSGIEISLKLEDVSCTEAWITLSSNLKLLAIIELKQNSQAVKTINLTKSDSLLYIDSLLPNTSYQIQASSSQYRVTSNQLQLTTLDTTSHNFSWQTWTFGEHSSSSLYDVAIIGENNIWAVGEIYMNDSLGQSDPQPYGIAHWDGTDWKLFKVPYHDFNQTVKYPGPLFSIDIIDGEIYVVSYANLLKWTGSDWEEVAFFMEHIPFDGQVLKMWGTDQNNIYCVGRSGSIYHYFGSDWQKLVSGTDIRLTDIYGTDDGKNLWACGWDNNHTGGIILSIENSDTKVIWDGISVNGEYLNFINTLWTNGGQFWLAGGFVFKQSVLFQDKGHLVRIPTETGSKLFDPGNFVLSIRGTGKNNIFLAGDLGMLWHFNGVSWHKYEELYSQQLDRRLYSISAKDNIVVAVGWKDSNAWIVLGTK
jgi:hypothetical protein